MAEYPYISTPRSFEGRTDAYPSLIAASGPRVRAQDWLALTLTTTDSTGSVEINGRILTDNGEIVPFTQIMTFSGTGTQTAVVARLAPGWLQGFSVHRVSGTLTDGEVQAAVHLGTGEGTTRRYECCLASGDVTDVRSLGIGSFATIGTVTFPSSTPVLATASSAPAAGADITFTVTASQVWQIQSLAFQFVTSATVAVRRLVIQVTNGTDNVASLAFPLTQAASTTSYYTFLTNAEYFDAGANGVFSGILPAIFMDAGWVIKTGTINLQAGDQFNSARLTYRRY